MAVISTNVSHPGGRVVEVGVFNRQKNASPWARGVLRVLVLRGEQVVWILGGLQSSCPQRCDLLLTEDAHSQPTRTRMRLVGGGDSHEGFT